MNSGIGFNLALYTFLHICLFVTVLNYTLREQIAVFYPIFGWLYTLVVSLQTKNSLNPMSKGFRSRPGSIAGKSR